MANLFEIAGRETLSQLDYVGSLNIQLWATLRGMRAALPLVGNRLRWRAAVHQMLDIGVDALPMVALLATCSGFILAMQGASELRRFGALHYVIDLVALGFTRELGPLLTAVAVSGRSGSAFAAEIGTMKSRRGCPSSCTPGGRCTAWSAPRRRTGRQSAWLRLR